MTDISLIPASVRKAQRQVIKYHIHTKQCDVYRKVVNRVGEGTVGGAPTFGGMGVLSSEDEHDFEHEYIGKGYFLPMVEAFHTDGDNFKDDGVNILYRGNVIQADIQPIADEGFQGYFIPQKYDIVAVHEGLGVMASYQIVGVTSVQSTLGYTRQYILNAQEDADVGI